MLKIDRRNITRYGAVIVLLVFLYVLGALKPLEGLVSSFLNPFMGGVHSLSGAARTAYNQQKNNSDLFMEIEALQEENIKLLEENITLQTAVEENKILREHLRFLVKNEHNYVLSNIVSRGNITDISGKTETIMIDQGSNDGIYPGLAVVSSRGVIVGMVHEVKEKISEVYLTNNKKCKLAATIMDEDRTRGITEGELGLTIKMGFIPQGTELEAGEVVITSGLQESIPRGLIIGNIIEVNAESNELWQEAIIEPMADPEELLVVSVLLP
jgi:rod shape-determining protein MreC